MVRIAIFMALLNLCGWTEEFTDVGYQELSCYDASRDREISFLVIYPCDFTLHSKKINDCYLAKGAKLDSNAIYPLVMYSHDHQGHYWESLWLGYALAQGGYIFTSVDHPGNTSYHRDIPDNYFSYWNRPLDISFVLSHVLSGSLSQHINQFDISMTGFSLGGLTTLWLAGALADFTLFKAILQQRIPKALPPAIYSLFSQLRPKYLEKFYHDYRFRRYIALAPDFGQAFTQLGLFLIERPVLCITSQSDTVTPPELNAQHYAADNPQIQSIVIPSSANHDAFITTPNEYTHQAMQTSTANMILQFLQDDLLLHNEHTS